MKIFIQRFGLSLKTTPSVIWPYFLASTSANSINGPSGKRAGEKTACIFVLIFPLSHPEFSTMMNSIADEWFIEMPCSSFRITNQVGKKFLPRYFLWFVFSVSDYMPESRDLNVWNYICFSWSDILNGFLYC